MSNFIKDFLRVGFSQGSIIIFGVLTSIVTARFMSPEDNGIIAALLVYPSLFITVGSLGIRQSTAYFLGKNIFNENQIKKAITQIWLFSSVMSLVICFLLMYYFSESGKNLIWVFFALLPIPFSLFNTYNSGIFLGKNEIGLFNKINWIPNFIILMTTVLLVVFLKVGINGYLVALTLGPLFMFFVLLFKNDFIKTFSIHFDWHIIKSMLTLGLVYAFSLLVINLNYRIDIILLDKLSTPYELGIYSKGANLTQYLWQIPMVLSTIVFARSATSKNDHLFSLKIAQLLRLSLVVVGLISFILYLFSDFIIYILFGENFKDSVNVLNILLPGVVLLTLFKVMNMDLAGKGKPWVSMKAMAPALVVNLVCNIILIPKLGAIGASYSSTISYSVAGILFLYFYSKQVKISIKEIISYKRQDFDIVLSLLYKLKK